MSTLNPKLTDDGIALYPQPMQPGFQVTLTHISVGTGKYAPTGAEHALVAEVARFPITSPGTSPAPGQVQMSANITDLDPDGHSPTGQWIGEIGFWAGNTLFAIWSRPDTPLFFKTESFDVPLAYTLDVSVLPVGSVVVNVSADAAGMGSMIQAHQNAADPHPQYWNNARGVAAITTALAGVLALDVSGNATTTPTPVQAANGVIVMSGAVTGNKSVVVPAVPWRWTVKHAGTGNFAVTVKTPAGTGIALLPGDCLDLFCDGVNVYAANATLPRTYSISALPPVNIGPVIVAELGETWIWVSTAYFTGYRSADCGLPIFGATTSPRACEVDSMGGLLPKTAPYLGLLAFAKENGLVVDQATWTANLGAHWFVDVDAGNFRVPDLRQQFASWRAGAPDPDTANARALGSAQLDALQAHGHNLVSIDNFNRYARSYDGLQSGGTGAGFGPRQSTSNSYFDDSPTNNSIVAQHHISDGTHGTPRTSVETRSRNTAYAARVHI